MVRVRILGSGREVGRAAILVEGSEGSLLMDYGVNFDERDNPIFPEHVRPRDLSGIILTHSHLDHVGASPVLFTSVKPRLYATPLTLDVSKLLLYDMIKLNGSNLPFDENVVNDMLASATAIGYNEEVDLGGLRFKLLYSGHIPGSAGVLVDVDGKTILYTSDTNIVETKLMNPARLEGLEVDLAIVESTYGSTTHPPREAVERRFYEGLREVVESGGTALVPVFSVSRGQEVLCILAERDVGWQVWVDGMVRDIAELYLEHRGYLRLYGLLAKAMREYIIIRGWQDRKAAYREPGVIVASSGMLKGGPSLYYLKRIAENPKNAIFLVSFQGRGTPGRQILENGVALQEEIPVRARVEWLDLSSHIDQEGIIRMLKGMKKAGKVALVHGMPKSQEALSKRIEEELGLSVEIPAVGDILDV